MELDNISWRNLKSIYLTISPIKKLVDSWCDCGTSSTEIYLTSFEARYFLRRLVIRAFEELYSNRKVKSISLSEASKTILWEGIPSSEIEIVNKSRG